ncbi:MAG: type III pantothenate kinase [Clostridia bacterium]|nr:type III pantothenate kinase [Clostridia bacterium]
MLLVFDIGNTQIKMGVFKDDELIVSCRMTTGTKKTADEYGIAMTTMLEQKGVDIAQISRTIVSSVVPNIMYSFCNAIRNYINTEPLVVAPGIKTGVSIKTDNPREVGADLITDVAAANHYYGGPCIVVDFGTATKYEVITAKGEFIACVISPGVGLMAEVLGSKTAQLPEINIRKPDTILTSNTVECMQAGIVYGYIGQVEYIVAKIKEEMGIPDMKVIATGGFGRMIANETDCIQIYDKDLTLKGLKLIADKNKK